MKKIAILQSNYIPWKGYFDLINSVDEFILYDDMQYTRRDWRNRNLIKTPKGVLWLTIPVEVKGKYYQSIAEVRIDGHYWREKHWKSLVQFYARSKYFKNFCGIFERLYLEDKSEFLSEVNYLFIKAVNEILNIQTRIRFSSEFSFGGDKTKKILDICKQCGADVYLSGPAAKVYFDENAAKEEGIEVEYMDYSGYREYHQLYPPFVHGVSIVDLIFNEGENAKMYLKSFAKMQKSCGGGGYLDYFLFYLSLSFLLLLQFFTIYIRIQNGVSNAK